MPLPHSFSEPPAVRLDLELMDGAWPTGLNGEVFYSFPWPIEGVNKLFGWGALGRLSLTPTTTDDGPRWAWNCAPIDTPSYRLGEALPEEFRSGPTGLSGPLLGVPNMVNTAPLPWGRRLFATWDVGRPVEVDPATLGYLGTVGDAAAWGVPSLDLPGLLPFYFSTAHPVIDPERQQLWTVKLTPSSQHDAGATGPASMSSTDLGSQLNLVRWSGHGGEVDIWPLPETVVFGSAHTVGQTRHWVVLADSGNFKTDLGAILGGERTACIDEEVSLYLVSKAEAERSAPGTPLSVIRYTVRPTFGHFYPRWDDSDGVHILFEHLDGVDLADAIQEGDIDADGNPVRPDLIGMYSMAMAPSTVSEWHFDPEGATAGPVATFRNTDWGWNLQLSAMDWSLAGQIQPRLHHLVYQGRKPEAVAQRTLARYAGRFEMPQGETLPQLVSLRRCSLEVHSRYEFPEDDILISSPTFVRRGASGGEHGTVVVAVLSDDGFRFEIFDAAEVGRGPVARLAPPDHQTLPLLLHSAWWPHSAGQTGPSAAHDSTATGTPKLFDQAGEFNPAFLDAIPQALRDRIDAIG